MISSILKKKKKKKKHISETENEKSFCLFFFLAALDHVLRPGAKKLPLLFDRDDHINRTDYNCITLS